MRSMALCPPDAAKLLEFLRERLSAYKLPHAVHFVDEIPRTGSGKILRFRLRERLGAPLG